MPDELFPSRDKTTKAKRTPRRWSVIIIEILAVLAAGIAVFRVATTGEVFPSLDAAKQYEWGVVYHKEGSYEKAVEALTAAIDQGYTPVGRAYFERGRNQYALKNYAEAVDDYTQSIALTPNCDDCYVDYKNRGVAYWMLRDYEAARQDFNQAIEINPRYFAAYTALADLENMQGNHDQALADIQSGLEKSARDVVDRGLANGQQRSVQFDSEGQQYHFTFSASVGDEVTLTITHATLDVVIALQESDGTVLVYDDSEAAQGGDSLDYVIQKAGDYTLVIAAYELNATGDITLAMVSTNPDEESLIPNAPRIEPDNVEQLTVVDTITSQSTGQSAIASNGMIFAEKANDQLIIYDLRDKPFGYNAIEVDSDLSWGVAISPDGELAAVGFDSTLILYDAVTGSVQQTLRLGDAYPSAMAFSPDSATIAVVIYNEVKIYDAISGSLLHTLSMDPIYGQSLAFSRDGMLLAVGQDKGLIQIWDVANEHIIRTLETGKLEEVQALAFSPNADLLAAGGEARRVQVWDVSSGGLREQYAVHERQITDLAFSPDGQLLASASEDGAVHLWSMIEGRTTPVEILSHEGAVRVIEFQADGRTLLAAADDYKFRFWRVKE
jgi:WD40 repeat protein